MTTEQWMFHEALHLDHAGIVESRNWYIYIYIYIYVRTGIHIVTAVEQVRAPAGQLRRRGQGMRDHHCAGHGGLEGCNTVKTHRGLNTAAGHSWSTNTETFVWLCVNHIITSLYCFIVSLGLTYKQNKSMICDVLFANPHLFIFEFYAAVCALTKAFKYAFQLEIKVSDVV